MFSGVSSIFVILSHSASTSYLQYHEFSLNVKISSVPTLTLAVDSPVTTLKSDILRYLAIFTGGSLTQCPLTRF